MATRNKSRRGKKSVTVNFDNVGTMFEPDMEYALEVKEAEVKDGTEFPYIEIHFKGVDDEFENSIMYHNASVSPQALWRLKPLIEALGLDVPEGDLDPQELAEQLAEDFVGCQCMANTKKEPKPDGGYSIKPEDFWPLEDKKSSKKKAGKKSSKDDDDEDDEDDAKGKSKTRGKRGSKKSEEPAIDFDEIDDADIKKLGKEFQIKSKKADEIREKLAEADEDEVRSACEDLEIELPGGDDDDDGDEADDKKSSKRGSKKGSSKKRSAKLTQDEVNEMSEEELEEVVERYDLDDVDLSEHKTLKKKKAAVIDALQEAGKIDD